MVINFSFCVSAETINICHRTQLICRQIQKEITVLRGETGLPEQVDCATVQREELEQISSLIIAGKKEYQLEKLTSEDFRFLKGLKYLDLGEHRLEELPEDLFQDLEELEVLNISNNKIKTLGKILEPLVSLKHVFLYGNKLGVSLSQASIGSPFSKNVNLMRVVLSYNGISELSDGLFSQNANLKEVILSYNALKSIPKNFFHPDTHIKEIDLRLNSLNAESLVELFYQISNPVKVDAIWNRGIQSSEYNLIRSALKEESLVFLNENDLKEPTESEASLRNSPVVKDAVNRVQEMTMKYWNLPFMLDGFFSGKVRIIHFGGLERAIEEKMVIRELNEAKYAYRTTPYDFHGVDISFVEGLPVAGKKIDVTFDRYSIHLKLKLPVRFSPVVPTDDLNNPWVLASFFVTTGDMLDTLSETFDWRRNVLWYRNVDRHSIKQAIHRDVGKIEKIQKKCEIDIFLLRELIEEIVDRSKESNENVTLSETDLEYARFIQFRIMFSLQRLLNTLARWRAAFYDNAFQYSDELTLLLQASTSVFRAYLNSFLRTVSDKISTGRRNPLFKMLNKELQDSLFVHEGRRSIAFPEGSLIDLLELRKNGALYQWFKEIENRFSRNIKVNPLIEENLSENMKPAGRSVIIAKKILADNKNKLSSVQARILIGESEVKDTFRMGFYKIVRKVGALIGDIRIHLTPALSEDQLVRLEKILEPGDIILIRQNYHASNLFLPGFWTHAILYLGSVDQWEKYKIGKNSYLTEKEFSEMGFSPNTELGAISSLRNKIQSYRKGYYEREYRLIEAVGEGVIFNSLKGAVQKDYVAILRPQFDMPQRKEEGIARAIYNALRLEGRPYDFDFDFTTDDKVVCTELIYRAYDWYIHFSAQKNAPVAEKPVPRIPGVKTVAGRDSMSAQEVARLIVYMNRHRDEIRSKSGNLLYPGQKLKLLRLIAKVDEKSNGNKLETIELEGLPAFEWLTASAK